MDVLIEFGFSIAVSILCACVFAKFVFDSVGGLNNCKRVSERRDGFVRKRVEVGEFDGNVRVVEDEVFGEVEDGGRMEGFGEECDLVDCADKVFDESPEREFGEEELGLVKDIDVVKEDLVVDDDGWERIDSSELEKLFCSAVMFVGCRSNADKIMNLGSNVKMQLYGLQKIATEGPGHEPQPMALKVSARTKWNAWQQLGNMSSEAAMEQYITLLSKSIPGWVQDNHGVSVDFEESETLDSDLKTSSQYYSVAVNESCFSSRKPVKLRNCFFDETSVGDQRP